MLFLEQMNELKSSNPLALQYLLTEDLYLVDEVAGQAPAADQPPVKVEEAPLKETLPEPAKEQPAEYSSFDYLGENNKYVLLLTSDAAQKIMAPKELEALQSILGAKKMEMKDVALVNLHRYPGATFAGLKSFFVCSKVVLFGINPQQIQLPPMASNKITDFQGTKILATFSFAEMMDTLDKKKAFWTEMKGL